MIDAIGQEINEGDIVLHGGGHYARLERYEVIKVCKVKVTVKKNTKHKYGATSLWPYTLVVVTDLIPKA